MITQPRFVKSHVPLAAYTTFNLGGPAKYFAEAADANDILEAVKWANRQHIKYFALGGGSNVLISDQGVDGLVIHPTDHQLTATDGLIIAAAGVKLDDLVEFALAQGRGGLKFLIRIPGQVGGSVAGNAGGHDGWLGQFVVWVEVVDATGEMRRLPADQCDFTYRHSALLDNNYVVTRAAFNLPPVDPVAERKIIDQAIATKTERQPLDQHTAGCTFRNVEQPSADMSDELRAMQYPDGSIPAWKLIDAVDLAGYKLGAMQMSPKHANFLINTGGGTTDQAMQLISLVKQRVRDKYGIMLQEEIRYLGFE
jgi:UDP-N-acetylmuramate dehydrogenase